MMSHDEALELLGAYALDAVDGEELQQLESHVDTCPRCRAELDTWREVAGALGQSVEPLPEGLWSSIVSRLPERPAEGESPPMPHLVAQTAEPPASPVPAPAAPRRRARAAVVAIAAVAAALVAALAVGLVRADDRASNLQAQSARQANASAVHTALATPGHQVVTLDSSSGAALASFVVVPDGRGYLLSSHLPVLSGDRTYQLWGIFGTRPISLGLLGPSPRQATFTMASSAAPSALSVTAEPAGGAVAPSTPIVATGTV
jgi:anti-sigma factor RsiW